MQHYFRDMRRRRRLVSGRHQLVASRVHHSHKGRKRVPHITCLVDNSLADPWSDIQSIYALTNLRGSAAIADGPDRIGARDVIRETRLIHDVIGFNQRSLAFIKVDQWNRKQTFMYATGLYDCDSRSAAP